MRNKLSEGEQALYQEVLQSIAGLRLLPGRKLTEETLAEAFEVSRSKVRQVLSLLEADGIVARQPNRGAYVSHPSPTEALEVFEARRLIEIHLLQRTVENVTQADITDLKALLAQKQHVLDTEHFANTTGLSGAFHMRLAAISGHQTLVDVLQSLIYRSYLAVALYQKGTLAARAQHAHASIIRHLETRNAIGLRAQMGTHFDHVLGEMDFSENRQPSRFDKILND